MIIYGRRGTHIGSVMPNSLICTNCNSTGTVTMSAFTNYAHIFWIPLFPFGKTVVSQCQHCKQVLNEKEMPSEFRTYLTELKGSTKTPVWTFAGLLLIGVLIGWGVYSSGKEAELNKALVADPKAGDVYEVKTETNNYTLYQVTEVMGDTVLFLANKFEISKSTKLYDIDKQENFETDTLFILKSALVEMFDKKEIVDVNRK